MLTGLIPLDAGRLLADGEPIATDQMQDYRDRISAVFSDYHLSDGSTASKTPILPDQQLAGAS